MVSCQIFAAADRLAYYTLKEEDGQIYDNIRYHPHVLLSIDRSLIEYMNYVNQLEPSIWSRIAFPKG